jgi:hypothetical protein
MNLRRKKVNGFLLLSVSLAVQVIELSAPGTQKKDRL